MNKINYLLTGLTLLLIASCSIDSGNSIPGRVSISAANASFDSGDEIGLYITSSTQAGSKNLAGERFLDNVKFICNGDEFIPSEKIFYPEDISLYHNLYAYYPYRENFIENGNTYADAAVLADQSEDLSSNDLQYAMVEDFRTPSGTPQLKFKHALTKVNIKVRPGGYYENIDEIPQNGSITVKNVITDGRFNLENGEFTLGNTVSDITPNGVLKANGSVLSGISFILPPQVIPAEHEFIVFDMEGDIFRLICPQDLDLKAGAENTLTIKLNADFSGAIVSLDVDIDDWKDGKDLEWNEDEILPPSGNSVTDVDGNEYPIVKIGRQYWMGANLRTTKLNDGTPIAEVTSVADWHTQPGSAYTAYNNDNSDIANYGLLYNRTAVETNRLCPDGWHLPSETDWDILGAALNGVHNEWGAWLGIATSMKSTEGWDENGNGTNASGFNAYPAGYIYYLVTEDGKEITRFADKGSKARFWSFTAAISGSNSFIRTLSAYEPDDELSRFVGSNDNGYSVRCVHDF